MNKRASLLFVFLLLFQTIASGLALPSQIKAEGIDKSVFTSVKVTDEDGNVLRPDATAESKVYVYVDWSVSGLDIKEGNTETFTVHPEIFFEQQQTGILMDEAIEVGTYETTEDGAVIVKFTKTVEDYPEASGTIEMEAFVVHAGEEEVDDEAVQVKVPAEQEEANTEEADETNSEGSLETESKIEKEKASSKEESETTSEVDEEDGGNTSIVRYDVSEAKENIAQVNEEEKHGFVLELGQVTDLDGNPFTEENLLDPADEFWLKLDWHLENGHHYITGDTETFELPNGIKIIEEMTGDLLDGFGQTVATYKITTDKQVELTFTDFVETHSDVLGYLEIVSTLDEENVDVEDGEAIIEPIGEEGEIRIPIEEGSKEKTNEKKGTPNKGYNADEIHWEVIINKNKTFLKNATIIDVLPQGTEYKEDSLKVTKLKVDLYGNILGDGEEVDVTGETVVDGELIIPLGDIKDAFRIEYTTTITDEEEKRFKNHVTLSDQDLEDVSADATITINRGEAIKKRAAKGYNPKTGIIDWEIEFNYNEKNLENVSLTDSWKPKGKLELVEDSLIFMEVEIDENGNAHETGNTGLPEGAELVPREDGFEVTGITTDKGYKVTYQTKVKDRVLESFEVANTAGFGGESAESGTGIGTYYGSKSAGTVNYAAKTIDWKIEINHDEYPMQNISVLDTLGDGLTLIEDSIKVTVGGEEYKDFTLVPDNPFEIQFPKDYTTDEKIIVTYQSSFIADDLPENKKATNKAAVTWTPEGGSESITKEVDASTTLNWQTEQSDWKNGSYNPTTKEITWTIYTNYRENDIANLIVTDFPQGNQKIVNDSVVVKELAIAENGNITEGDTLDASVVNIDEAANSLTVIIGETDKAYKIQYRTSLVGLSDIQKEYVNKAEVLDGSEKLSDVEAKVGITKSDTYAEKSGYQDGKQVHWSVKVNLGQQKVTNLALEDTISDNQDYLAHTIKVYHATVDRNGNATKAEEVEADAYELNFTEGEQTFTIEWKNEVERAFIVEYSTLFFAAHQDDVTNTYKITGEQIVEDGHTDGGSNVTIRQLSSGGGSGEAGYLVIDKVDTTDGKEVKLASAEFDLIDPETGKVLKSGTTDENGQIDFGRLLFGDYELYERVVPDGYVTPEERQTITIDKVYNPDADKTEYAYTVENYEPVYAIELGKVDDLGEVLAGVTFDLYNSDDEIIATETTDEEGKILFEDLRGAGTYYLIETDAPVGYEPGEDRYIVEVGAKEKAPVSIKIENQRELIEIRGMKTWDDANNQDGIRPESITVNLLANGKEVDSNVVNGDGETWNYNFANLPKYENEEEIIYTVEEADVNIEGYTSEVEGFDITNSYTPEEIAITGKKTWDDVDNQDGIRPESITVNLLADGNLIESVNVTEKDNWEYSFKSLPKYDAGEEIVYTVTENSVEDYTQDIDGYDIRNHYTPKETGVTTTKNWQDANNQDGIRPESIEVQLTADGEAHGDPVELSEENDWTYTWKELPLNKEGAAIVYSVVETTEISGYDVSIDDLDHGNIILTNSHSPEKIAISGKKTWEDADNQDGKRPESVTVNLLADDVHVETIEVTGEDNWTYRFTDLPKYKDGNEINYTITEEPVVGYKTKIDGFDIVNVHEPEGTEIAGTKTWEDANNQDGVRPESITVNLLADGEEVQSIEVTEADDWKYGFKDLPKYKAGAEIVYSITENAVSEYTTEVDGTDIINYHTPGKTSATVTKHWDDADNQDGKRLDVIEVQLTANGETYGDPVPLSSVNNWTYTWDGLDEKAAGKAVEYSVVELTEVPEYDTTVNDADHGNIIITNAYTPEMIDVNGEKTWKDAENQEGNRPDSITVNLLANGSFVDSVEITKADDWNYSFTSLPKYEAGIEIDYTITENAVEGYETVINRYHITNVRAGETSVEGTKTWKDDNSEKRPESITVNLLRNDEVIDAAEVTAESGWTYEFENLQGYDGNGVAYVYTIEEEAVEGYETTVNGYDITNLRVGTTSVEGTKTWKDDNAEIRPESIVIELHQNGKKIETLEVTAADDWMFSFTDLQAYDENGVAYKYTVEEQEVAGYISTVEGYNITNTFIPVTPENEEPEGSAPGSKDDETTVDTTSDAKAEGDDLKKETERKSDADTGAKLPNTATNVFNLLAVGFGLLVVGFITFLVYRRKEKLE